MQYPSCLLQTNHGPSEIVTALLTRKTMLRPNQIAVILGVSTRTLQRWRKDNSFIPWHKVGRTIFYDPADIAHFILKGSRHG